jgi:YidC/Oxa1 family membrane protein insertase
LSIPLLDGAVAVAYPLVAHAAAALTPVGGAATAIVLCAAALRLALLPLTLAAVRGERSGAALAGCLPSLVQAPFFMIAYRIFTVPGLPGQFLGVPLATRLVGGGYPLAFLPVIAALLALGWLSARRMRRVALATGRPEPTGVVALVPYLSVTSVLVVPLAAALYLVTSLAWTVAENAVLHRGLPAGSDPAGDAAGDAGGGAAGEGGGRPG